MVFPLLAGPVAPFVFTGNLTANLTRNLWSFMIIFCGHFPEGTQEFTEEEVGERDAGGWYVRQMLGSANLTGSRLFHILSGNLSHQIEHHLFPDIPAHRYAEIAAEVREICARYGLPYNSGPLHKQFGSVVKKIVRLALPGRGGGRGRSSAGGGSPSGPPQPEQAAGRSPIAGVVFARYATTHGRGDMREGLMMDDYPLSLTAVVERAERFSGRAGGRLPAPRRIGRADHLRRLRRAAPGAGHGAGRTRHQARRPGRHPALEPARARGAVLRTCPRWVR